MEKSIVTNPVLEKLPEHLFQYIHPQSYERYTPINQATWRYVMRRNVAYLGKMAHESYLDGLKKTGISTDTIPSMYGMNRILKDIGWAAVAVDGFIPPAAFMEFQAYNVLVIASEIRQLANIEYTPAPDIIHESAGHAPIIANPEYAEYLRRFGEIGSKAISSKKDYELYEAIRHLSILKEAENSSETEIKVAEVKIEHLQKNMGTPSEMARIRNLHWWTVEYGLIGSVESPKIYGAGLLSSIGESTWCMSDKVKKLPYNLSAADQAFDITQPQPQLFVTPDFAHLSLVLEEFANTMALRQGGLEGIQKLIDSNKLGTIELSTGLQISGIFHKVISDEKGNPAFFQTAGPTALAYHEKELIGHSTSRHADGFGSPMGKLKGINIAIEDMSPIDLEAYNIYEGRNVKLEFEGGISLSGEVITGTRNLQGKIILVAFKNCLVTHRGSIIFKPEQGIYHLAVGKRLTKAFAGPADPKSFDLSNHELSPTPSPASQSERQRQLEELYQKVRKIRMGEQNIEHLSGIYQKVQQDYSSEWLLLLEIYEMVQFDNKDLAKQCLSALANIKEKKPAVGQLIDAGLQLLPISKPS